MKEKPIKHEYIRNLPHFYPVGGIFFVTFCLYGSLPKEIIAQYRFEKNQAIAQRIKVRYDKDGERTEVRCTNEIKYEEQKRYFAKIDSYLDKAQGDWILKNNDVSQIVADKMHQFDGEFYDLIAYCIMSNHVHWVFDLQKQIEQLPENVELTTQNYVQVESIMQRIKGGSAFEINKFLGTKGRTVWQPENYDHYVRNHKELENIIRYVLHNPVKAGLVTDWQDWKFSYLNDEL
jgi:putative transposase